MIRYFLAVAVIFVYGGAATYIGLSYGAASVRAEWDTEKAAIITAKREKEAALQANMDTLREAYRNETAKLATNVRNLSNSLRNRPSRPASMPEVASAGDGPRGCTGAELYKPDGEFLVGESSRADQLRLALKACQKAYQDARQ